jgi:hypothetical protein
LPPRREVTLSPPLWLEVSRRVIAASLLCTGLGIATHSGVALGASPKIHVPVVICPTEFGASRPTNTAKIPRTAPVDLTLGQASVVADFTDTAQWQSVLGPRGWRCSASYGADGNGGITIYPTSESIGFSGVYLNNKPDLQAINADWSPACVDCILSQSCPFFARARALYSALKYPTPGTVCRRPRGEKVTLDGTSLAAFTDPPGAKGSATPSGGRYRAFGQIYWAGPLKLVNGHAGTNGSVVVSCTVASDLEKVCGESFAYFALHDDSKLKAK